METNGGKSPEIELDGSRGARVGIGAAVHAPDHFGHGRSEEERALCADIDAMAADVASVARLAAGHDPGVPLALVGHSMGGLITTRLMQLDPPDPAAVVLSGRFIGGIPPSSRRSRWTRCPTFRSTRRCSHGIPHGGSDRGEVLSDLTRFLVGV